MTETSFNPHPESQVGAEADQTIDLGQDVESTTRIGHSSGVESTPAMTCSGHSKSKSGPCCLISIPAPCHTQSEVTYETEEGELACCTISTFSPDPTQTLSTCFSHCIPSSKDFSEGLLSSGSAGAILTNGSSSQRSSVMLKRWLSESTKESPISTIVEQKKQEDGEVIDENETTESTNEMQQESKKPTLHEIPHLLFGVGAWVSGTTT